MQMRQALAALALVAFIPTAAAAHHGWNSYDATRTLTVDGVIKDSGYEHPHGHVSLEAPDKTWSVVLAPPSRLENRGVSREMLAPGTRVTVVGRQHLSDAGEMRAERITIDGKTVVIR